MTIHFTRDMDRLHQQILSMFALVEELINRAVEGLHSRSSDVVAELRDRDNEVNRRDVLLEEECLKILALHHPVAVDLRRVATVMKITGELERVADIGVNIAERAAGLAKYSEPAIPDQMKHMSEKQIDQKLKDIEDEANRIIAAQEKEVEVDEDS